MNHIVQIIILFLFLLPRIVFSDITEKTDNCWAPAGCYEITGSITKNDIEAIDSIDAHLKKTENIMPNFSLDSNGGDVESAIYMGRKLRRFRASAIVLANSACYSSCVFVLAGATQRVVAGKVGIHRPYSTKTGDLKYEELQSTSNRLNHLAKSYLSDMNLPPSLFDEMIRIPSHNLRVLSEQELDKFGLNATDPVEQEYFDSKAAAKYKLSKTEYLLRKAQVESACKSYFNSGKYQQYAECQWKIFTK